MFTSHPPVGSVRRCVYNAFFVFFIVCYCATSGARGQGISPDDQKLITDLIERAAYAQALVDFCDAEAPATGDANRRALAEWHERNRWSVFSARLEQQPKFNNSFAELRQSFVANLKKQQTPPAEFCQYVPALTRRAEFDPSAQRAQEIQLLAGRLGQSPGGKNPLTTAGDDSPSSSPATTVAAQPVQPAGGKMTAGAVTFDVPPGWTVSNSSGATVTLTHRDKDNSPSSILIGADALEGPLPDALRRLTLGAFRDLDLKLEYINQAQTAYGHAAVYFTDTARHRTKRLKFRLAGVAVNVSGRMQVAWLMTPDNVGYYERQRELEALVRSWKYVGGPDAPTWDPLKPPRGSGGLSGFFWGNQLRNQINPFGGMDLIAHREYLVLLPDGQAYSGVPPGGRVLDMDFAAELRRSPGGCGTYAVRGGQLVFDWLIDYGFVKRVAVPITRAGSKPSFTYQGMAMSEIRPVRNLRVDGKYTSTFAMTGNMAGSSTSVSSQSTIEFTRGGRYQKSGFSGFSFSNSGGDGTTSGAGYNPRAPQTGSYEMDGYRLTLKPDNGPVEIFTLIVESAEPEVKALFLDDKAFLK